MIRRGSTYRPRRRPQRRTFAAPAPSEPEVKEARPQPDALKPLTLPPTITVKALAERIEVTPIEVIKQLMRNGLMAAINQAVDFQTAAMVAAAFGFLAKSERPTASAVAVSATKLPQEEDDFHRVARPPVVTVLGHVDHGKTTLLDTIRKTRVAAREAGGITQHIGAYQVTYKEQKITFLDTPGHEAFTAMRARGAKATDIAVLVVAADDGVMPQTVEALDHARAAAVPIVVAINKVDLPGADIEKVKRQLGELGLVLEEWGGDVIAVLVSAKKGIGIENLLENIQVVAEVSELKANPDRPASGVVIEARLEKSSGPVATVLVQSGTLHVGDIVVAGSTYGRVKAMTNDAGKRMKEASPATPAGVLGFSSLPEVGETLQVVADEGMARTLAEEHAKKQRGGARALTLEELYGRISSGEVKELNLVIKADVQGSIEALRAALEKLSTDKAKVRILHAGSGTITESDVLLAKASNAVVVGFNAKAEPGAQPLAEREGVQVRHYNIIYRLVEDVDKALQGILEPTYADVVEGRAQVREVFSVSKRGKIAGCQVNEGRLVRGAPVRVIRGEEVFHESIISSLRHYKQDVTEMAAGFECGVGVEGFNDFQVGDILETHRRERVS